MFLKRTMFGNRRFNSDWKTRPVNLYKMKHTAIKSAFIRIAALLLFLMGPVTASAQYKMVVHTDDGLSYTFNTEKVKSVSFVLTNTDNEVDEEFTTTTGNVSEITDSSATIIAWAIIDEKMPTDLNIGIIFSTAGTPNNNNGTWMTVNPSSIGIDGKYIIKLTDLAPSTTYYYRSFICQSGVWHYGDVKEFTTMGKVQDSTPGGNEGIGGGQYD